MENTTVLLVSYECLHALSAWSLPARRIWLLPTISTVFDHKRCVDTEFLHGEYYGAIGLI